jgi:hypothetical protein
MSGTLIPATYVNSISGDATSVASFIGLTGNLVSPSPISSPAINAENCYATVITNHGPVPAVVSPDPGAIVRNGTLAGGVTLAVGQSVCWLNVTGDPLPPAFGVGGITDITITVGYISGPYQIAAVSTGVITA